eukprot:GHVS01103159.1.p1 GENE.GHVS01103159.1~~GHVS01103159.1.p1  ORF type:complete len:453 (+),score=130.80 GHVS01103159.1:186-1544(+)
MVKTVQRFVPKARVEEKVVEVPKYVPKIVEKYVEVPEIQFVDKIVEVPDVQYQYKYEPKIETRENIVQSARVEIKYVEKIVEVPQVKEVIRYEEVEVPEIVTRYIPRRPQDMHLPLEHDSSSSSAEVTSSSSFTAPGAAASTSYTYQQQQPVPSYPPPQSYVGGTHPGMQHFAPPPPPQQQQPPTDPVFVPKVVKSEEEQKHIPVSVDVPVPYMVPRPVVVPVQVPVLKFRDHFVPVPVRRRVVPRIRWTDEVFEVECVKEKPFLQVQDVIKPVACDVEIRVHEFVQKTSPINPTELSQADVHAMWMRVNADLAEQRRVELGSDYPTITHPPGTVFKAAAGESGGGEEEGGGGDPQISTAAAGGGPFDATSLHPGHPLSMPYLQNEWMKQQTTDTQQMYTPEWFEAHQRALHGMNMQHPTQVQLTPQQAALCSEVSDCCPPTSNCGGGGLCG